MNGTRLCAVALAGLLLLRLVWHAVEHAPLTGMASGVATLLLPLLPFFAAFAFKLRGPWIYGGIAAWVYLCHGGMEAVANPPERGWALAEMALASLYFAGLWLRVREAKAAARQ
ncbi:MAG TPA: DUF2069 domain-containing protein [Xanthomonadales bacterium]|nr:DUF2069 domain-containing protein [Xanthomonadales bacterium]